MALPKSPDTGLSDWTDVAHLSRLKLAAGGTLYMVAGIAVLLILPAPDSFERVIGMIGTGFCLVMGLDRLWMVLFGRWFFRVSQDAIWYRQAPGVTPLWPAREVRIPWPEVTKWYPYSFRLNGIPVYRAIVFETFNRETHGLRKHKVLLHPYGERTREIVANIKATKAGGPKG